MLPLQGPLVQAVLGKLRSHMPRAMAKKKNTKNFSFKVAVVKAIEKAVLKKINSRGKNKTNKQKKSTSVNFLNCPVVKTRGFHYRGHGFDPWLGKFCMPLAKTTATGTS